MAWFLGGCVPEGTEEQTVSGGALNPRQAGSGRACTQHTDPRGGARGSGVPHVKSSAVGSPAPCTPVLKCFSFWRETGGGREEGTRAQEGVPVFSNTERQMRLMVTNER